MPPKMRISKTDVVNTALSIIRRDGESALNARNIAAELGCSTQPVFSNFSTMEELKAAALCAANTFFQKMQAEEMEKNEFPPYKASGMAYIRFAKEEKELFRFLFMRDRSNEEISDNTEEIDALTSIIQKNTGLSKKNAVLFHLQMWVYVHGIASMIATGYLAWEWDFISRILTDAYQGMIHRYKEQG